MILITVVGLIITAYLLLRVCLLHVQEKYNYLGAISKFT